MRKQTNVSKRGCGNLRCILKHISVGCRTSESHTFLLWCSESIYSRDADACFRRWRCVQGASLFLSLLLLVFEESKARSGMDLSHCPFSVCLISTRFCDREFNFRDFLVFSFLFLVSESYTHHNVCFESMYWFLLLRALVFSVLFYCFWGLPHPILKHTHTHAICARSRLPTLLFSDRIAVTWW